MPPKVAKKSIKKPKDIEKVVKKSTKTEVKVNKFIKDLDLRIEQDRLLKKALNNSHKQNTREFNPINNAQVEKALENMDIVELNERISRNAHPVSNKIVKSDIKPIDEEIMKEYLEEFKKIPRPAIAKPNYDDIDREENKLLLADKHLKEDEKQLIERKNEIENELISIRNKKKKKNSDSSLHNEINNHILEIEKTKNQTIELRNDIGGLVNIINERPNISRKELENINKKINNYSKEIEINDDYIITLNKKINDNQKAITNKNETLENKLNSDKTYDKLLKELESIDNNIKQKENELGLHKEKLNLNKLNRNAIFETYLTNQTTIGKNPIYDTNKLPNESDTDYINRMEQNAQIANQMDMKKDITKDVIDRFRRALKTIFKKNSTIEEINNNIEHRFNEKNSDVVVRLKLLKIFPKISRDFIKTYGTDPYEHTADNFFQFIKKYESDAGIKEREIKPQVVEENKPVEDIDFENNKKKFKKIASNYIGVIKAGNDYKLLVSTSGLKGSFKHINSIGELFKIISKKYFDEAFNDITADDLLHIESLAKYIYEKGHGFEKNKDQFEKVGSRYVYGMGINKDIPETVEFGKYKLFLHRLIYDNVLKVKIGNMNVIEIPNTPVSNEFAIFLNDLCKNGGYDVRDYNLLKKHEQTLFNKLVKLSGVKSIMPPKDSNEPKNHIDRLRLIKEEVEIGNNSQALLKEAKFILNELVREGEIDLKESKRFYKELISIN